MQHHGENWRPLVPTDTSLPIPSLIRQIDALQLLRAVAVILVIWVHSGQVLDFTGSHALPNLGAFGIDLFFVISGFILSLVILKDRSHPGLHPMLEFMKRRVLRIYPIYWVICIFTLARAAAAHHLFDHNWLPAFFLLPSLHYPDQVFIINFSWTMNFEIFFYFVLGLVLLVTIKRAITVLIGLLIASITTGAFLGTRHPVAILVANPILLEFVFGAIIALVYARLGRRRIPGIVLATIGTIGIIYVAYYNFPWAANGEQMIMADIGAFGRVATWGLCAALIVAGTVFWSPSMKSAPGKFFVLLGNASYSTYLTSAFFLEFSFRAFFKLHAPPLLSTSSRLLFETSMLIAILTGGFLVYSFVEKPLLRLLQNKFLSPTIHASHPTPLPSPPSAHAAT
jgi:peptidoglycan/LPS O-acetylase OafA/YrhL